MLCCSRCLMIKIPCQQFSDNDDDGGDDLNRDNDDYNDNDDDSDDDDIEKSSCFSISIECTTSESKYNYV